MSRSDSTSLPQNPSPREQGHVTCRVQGLRSFRVPTLICPLLRPRPTFLETLKP